MNTFFEDNFINKKFFSLMKREVEKEQLHKTIDKIDYLNELQENLLKRKDIEQIKQEQSKVLKQFNNARRNNYL